MSRVGQVVVLCGRGGEVVWGVLGERRRDEGWIRACEKRPDPVWSSEN